MNSKIYNTSKLECELLNIMLSDKMTLSRIFPLLKDYWWTDESRLFFFNKVLEYYTLNKTLISKDMMIYEIGKYFPEAENKTKHDGYMVDLEQIVKIVPSEGAAATVSMKANFGRARNYGERSIGTKDAGAASWATLFEAFSKAI